MTCVTEPAIPFTGFFSPEHCLLQLTRLDVQGSGQVPRSVELLPIPLIAKGLLTGVYFGRGDQSPGEYCRGVESKTIGAAGDCAQTVTSSASGPASRPWVCPLNRISPLTPDLKAFIDRVIVPTLVRDYLDVLLRDERVEVKSDSVTSYGSDNSASAEKAAS